MELASNPVNVLPWEELQAAIVLQGKKKYFYNIRAIRRLNLIILSF